MEVIGGIANVGAVIDIAAKVIALCSNYLTAVAKARAEIARLQKQVECLQTVLQDATHLLNETPDGRSLSTSRKLNDALEKCGHELDEVHDKLEPSTARQAMQRVGLHALRWPFKKGDVETIVASLANYRDTIATSLQIDQTTLLRINNGIEKLAVQTSVDVSVARKPHFIMPFPRDHDFVERPGFQIWIEQQYAGPASRMALVGLGGFGKSQIAIEFAHKTHNASPGTSVFWVHGSTKARFEESYRSIADMLMLPSRNDPHINILKLVRDWLQKDDVASWLMILDNADDQDVFFSTQPGNGPEQEPLASFLPKTDRGKILITSRNLNAAEKLTGSHKSIQRIHTMDSSEALQILRNKLKEGFDEDIAKILVCTLDFIPLAVNQAAAFINRRAPRVSVKSYLADFQRSERHRTSLLNSDAGDLRRHEGVSNSVVVTWQITFEQIRQERLSAAELLALMSLFHAQGIPEFMLSDYQGSVGECETSSGNIDENFENDLDTLRAYSLVNIPQTRGFFNMHSLVQFCTRTWLTQSGDLKRFQDLFLCLSAKHFPNGTFETWHTCQILMPHVQALLNQRPADEAGILNWSQLLTSISWYMLMQGNYTAAECSAKNAVQARRKILGDEHPSTLTSMANLASTYRNQGQWPEAERLDVQVMETRKRVLGDEHPDTLTSMANLASTYRNQGRWPEAERLEVQVMETRKRVLGDEYPDTLTSMNNLSLTLQGLGCSDEALALMRKCVSYLRRNLGSGHPNTITSSETLRKWEQDSV